MSGGMRGRTIRRALAGALLAPALAACAGTAAQAQEGVSPAPAAPAGETPEALAARLRAATVPASPRLVRFAWTLDESNARFRGDGVARFEAPARFRLDLFGPRGETYLAAALVDGEARVPPAVTERFRLPSPALLWAAVGVVEPPAGAVLREARADGREATLRYEAGDDVFEYRLQDGQLRQLRRLRRGGVAESVEVRAGEDGPRRAEYRDWALLRSLTLTPGSQNDVAAFPPDTWSPPGAGR